MTPFEITTLLVSLLAIFISFVSLIRTRKITLQQLNLEKKTAQLAQKQLEILKKEESEQNSD